jgi:hypothetical protein
MENQGHSQAAPLLVHEIGMKCDDGFKLAVELGGQGLVMGQHQGRFLQLLDDIGHCKCPAGTGDAQQSFKSADKSNYNMDSSKCIAAMRNICSFFCGNIFRI